jgi:hypothetical protein
MCHENDHLFASTRDEKVVQVCQWNGLVVLFLVHLIVCYKPAIVRILKCMFGYTLTFNKIMMVQCFCQTHFDFNAL